MIYITKLEKKINNNKLFMKKIAITLLKTLFINGYYIWFILTSNQKCINLKTSSRFYKKTIIRKLFMT